MFELYARVMIFEATTAEAILTMISNFDSVLGHSMKNTAVFSS